MRPWCRPCAASMPAEVKLSRREAPADDSPRNPLPFPYLHLPAADRCGQPRLLASLPSGPLRPPAASEPWPIPGKLRLEGVVRKEGCDSTSIVQFEPRPGSVGPEGTPSDRRVSDICSGRWYRSVQSAGVEAGELLRSLVPAIVELVTERGETGPG